MLLSPFNISSSPIFKLDPDAYMDTDEGDDPLHQSFTFGRFSKEARSREERTLTFCSS